MSIRTTFVLVVFLFLVAGYMVFSEEPRGSFEGNEEAPWFYTASMGDIERISVISGEFQEAFIRKDRVWRFDDARGLPLDQGRWGGITLLLSGPQSQRVLAGPNSKPERYGLDSPQLTIDVNLTGDRKIQVILGHVTPDGTYHYAMRQDDPKIYLVDATWGQVIGRLAEEPPYPEWYYQVTLDRMLFIGVVHKDSEIEFTKDYRGWRHTSGGNEYVDSNQWEEVLPFLGGPEDLSIVQDTIDDFEKYGLMEPETIVYAEFKPPFNVQESRRRVVIEIGAPEQAGMGFYAKIQGQPYLLMVNNEWRTAMIDLILNPPKIADSAPP